MPTPAPGVFAPRRRKPAQSPITTAIRSTVRYWDNRTLRVQHEGELLRAHAMLAPHTADLYNHSPHAPRLLANLTTELTRRGLLPC